MYLKKTIYAFLKNIAWHYTLAALFVKSIILLFMIQNDAGILTTTELSTDIPSIGAYFCFIAALLSFAWLFSGRAQLWYLTIINLAVSVLLICDLWYFRGFGTFLSLHLLNQTANLNNLNDSIFSMSRTADAMFLLDVVSLAAFISICKKIYIKTPGSVILFLLLLILPSAYISYVHYSIDVKGTDGRIFFRICWAPRQTITNLSPIGFHIYDGYKYWEDRKPLSLSNKEKSDIEAWFRLKDERLEDNYYKSLLKGKNLITIQVESLESFVINRSINEQEITPTLNSLLKNSLYFPDIYEQVNEGTSSDADFIFNTSLYPVSRGSTFFRYPYNKYNTLPGMLKKQGYSSFAVYPVKGSFWNWKEAMSSIGFQCMDIFNLTLDEQIGLGISDASYFRQVGPIISGRPQPFYAHTITLTSHGPFDLPDRYRELKLDEKTDATKLGGYFQCMHYTDKQIGLFLSELEKKGLLDNSVVMIYGDHTGVHKYYQDELDKMQPAEDWWQKNSNRIPVIIYQKDLWGIKLDVAGGQVDIMPTVAYLMGIDEAEYKNTAMGRNLLNTGESFAVLPDGTYIGTSTDEEQKARAVQGLEIADKIIRSNYFAQP